MDWGQRITPTGDSGNPYLSPKGKHNLGLLVWGQVSPIYAVKRLPQRVCQRAQDLLTQVRDGAHPQMLGARKLREYPQWWSLRLPNGYRLLLSRRHSGVQHQIVSHNDYDKLLARGKNAGFLAS